VWVASWYHLSTAGGDRAVRPFAPSRLKVLLATLRSTLRCGAAPRHPSGQPGTSAESDGFRTARLAAYRAHQGALTATTMNNSSEDDPIIFRYTRAMAIADGVLIDAMTGDFTNVSRQHFPGIELAMTASVFALIEGAVQSDSGADFAGTWHDVLWMSRKGLVQLLGQGRIFKVAIRGAQGLRWLELKIQFHPGDRGEDCATVMLTDED
jgi:hypothetical protein